MNVNYIFSVNDPTSTVARQKQSVSCSFGVFFVYDPIAAVVEVFFCGKSFSLLDYRSIVCFSRCKPDDTCSLLCRYVTWVFFGQGGEVLAVKNFFCKSFLFSPVTSVSKLEPIKTPIWSSAPFWTLWSCVINFFCCEITF